METSGLLQVAWGSTKLLNTEAQYRSNVFLFMKISTLIFLFLMFLVLCPIKMETSGLGLKTEDCLFIIRKLISQNIF